jgi:hypothetical protein
MRAADGAIGQLGEKIFRQFHQVGDVHAPVAAVPLPQLFRLKMLPVGSRDHRAANEVLNEPGRSRALRFRRRRWAGVGIFAVDARDAPPQSSELFLDILHSLFLCLI